MTIERDINRQLLDADHLADFLAEKLGCRSELSVGRLVAGKSNETFLLGWGDERWVLRRPPEGPLPPSAHNVLREHRILEALNETEVPVPRPILACDDESVIGAPFYIMERVEGRVLTRERPEEVQDPEVARGISVDIVTVLARLHNLDYRAIGLAEFGKPAGFMERQVTRRFSQLESVMDRCRQLPEMIALHEWLAAKLPAEEQPPALIHGDYGPHNVLSRFDPKPHVSAVLDWELSTIGDPMTDLGWMTALWRDPGDPGWGGTEGFEVTELPGFLRKKEVVELYSELTGRSTSNLAFYQVFALWKLAIALEGSYARYVAGSSDNPYYKRLEEMVPAMARVAMKWAGI